MFVHMFSRVDLCRTHEEEVMHLFLALKAEIEMIHTVAVCACACDECGGDQFNFSISFRAV